MPVHESKYFRHIQHTPSSQKIPFLLCLPKMGRLYVSHKGDENKKRSGNYDLTWRLNYDNYYTCFLIYGEEIAESPFLVSKMFVWCFLCLCTFVLWWVVLSKSFWAITFMGSKTSQWHIRSTLFKYSTK